MAHAALTKSMAAAAYAMAVALCQTGGARASDPPGDVSGDLFLGAGQVDGNGESAPSSFET